MESVENDPIFNAYFKEYQKPPAGDEILGAFNGAFAYRYARDPEFRNWYKELVEERKTRGPFDESHMQGMTQKLAVFLMLDRTVELNLIHTKTLEDREDYIQDEMVEPIKAILANLTNRAAWEPYIDKLFSDPYVRGDFEIFMSTKLLRLQTNIPERYWSNILAAEVLQKEALGNFTVLDIGAARNLGAAYMHALSNPEAAKHLRRFQPQLDQGSLSEREGFVSLLNGRHPFYRYIHGIDVFSMRDPMLMRWQICCRNPSEFLNDDIQNQEQFLERYRDRTPNIFFTLEDFSKPITEDIPERLATSSESTYIYSDPFLLSQRFNQASCITTMYQQTAEERRRTTDNIEERLEEDGYQMVTDHFELSDEPTEHPIDQLKFLPDWRKDPYTYRTAVRRKGSERFELLAEWETGRGARLRPMGKLLEYLERAT